MAVADDDRRSDPSGHPPAVDSDVGRHGDLDAVDRAQRPNIDRIADKVKGILRPRH